MRRSRSSVKRREAAEPGTRAERIIRVVTIATLGELARSGYAALNIEEVALRAGVNKTTVYRRWPTKHELVEAALQSLTERAITAPDGGSFRADLLAISHNFVRFQRSPGGAALMRMMLGEDVDPKLGAMLRAHKKKTEPRADELVLRAISRGEIPEDTDPHCLFNLLFGAITAMTFLDHARVTQDDLEKLVGVVVAGAKAGAARGARVARGGTTTLLRERESPRCDSPGAGPTKRTGSRRKRAAR